MVFSTGETYSLWRFCPSKLSLMVSTIPKLWWAQRGEAFSIYNTICFLLFFFILFINVIVVIYIIWINPLLLNIDEDAVLKPLAIQPVGSKSGGKDKVDKCH